MLHISQKAPVFEHVTAYQKGQTDFIKIDLKNYLGKWLIFFFYPRDFTFICPTELKGFSKHKAEFTELNADVLACSTDSEWSHKNWFERDLPDVDYPILADNTHKIAMDYDVYNEVDGLAERGTFIIDPEGILRYALISSGSVGRSVTETLRVLKALQSGELCPVEWNQGDQTLGKA